MPRYLKIHTEGGPGKGRREKAVAMRNGFSAFLKEVVEAGSKNDWVVQVVLWGARQEAYEKFCYFLTSEPENTHLLLVDSEEEVLQDGKCWAHVKKRQGDGWERPIGVTDDELHFMAQAVEAWFFADPDALATYFGKGFKPNSLAKNSNVEKIPKDDHIYQLEAATKATSKGAYHKMSHPPDLLARIAPEKVRARAPHCERLFTTALEIVQG